MKHKQVFYRVPLKVFLFGDHEHLDYSLRKNNSIDREMFYSLVVQTSNMLETIDGKITDPDDIPLWLIEAVYSELFEKVGCGIDQNETNLLLFDLVLAGIYLRIFIGQKDILNILGINEHFIDLNCREFVR